MRLPDPLVFAAVRGLAGVHHAALRLTGGRFPRTLLGMLPVELHTVGRKSGRPFTTTLSSPVHDDERIVVVASKGGYSDDPDWYKNAVANPDVHITVGGVTEPARARTATPDERAELWPKVVKAHRWYASYQRNTDREIPLLILDRTPRA